MVPVILVLFTASPALCDQEGSLQAQTAIQPAGTVEEMVWAEQPPALSERQKAQLKSMVDKFNLPTPVPVSDMPVAGPEPMTETIPSDEMAVDPLISSPPQVWVTRDLVNVDPSGFTSNVTEPAAANVGKYVFYSANWFAARSSNQGATWNYVSPYSGFSDFCCDQDVIYDKSNDVMFWLRMGSPDVNGENQFKVGASTDGGQSYCTYTISTIGSGTNEWYDYPHLALTNNYLYMSWNMFNAVGSYVRSRVMRWPIQPMSQCQSLSFSFFDDTGGTMTPANGGTSKAYIGQHRSTSTLRVYSWQEFTDTINIFDRSIPAWTTTNRTSAHCACPDGNDPCQRLDSRITSGYVKRHKALAFSQLEIVGFFWTVAEGAGFPFPYSNNAWFYTNTMNYGGRDFIWNNERALIYPAASTDRRGNIGIVADWVGGSGYTSVVVMKDDDTDGLAPPFIFDFAAQGDACPSNDQWGDYNRVREFMPVGTCWLGTGHVLQGGTTGNFVHPYYFIFGNPRDFYSCYLRWRQLG
jgi:hypothetical protein